MFKKLQSYLPLVSLVLALLLLFSSFFNALSVEGDPIMTGIKAIFGGNIGSIGSFASADVQFSFLNLIGFFLPAVIAIITAIYGIRNQKASATKLFLGLILAVAFILSVIFVSSTPDNTTAMVTLFGGETTFDYGSASLGIGAVLGLIFSILGTISSIMYALVQIQE